LQKNLNFSLKDKNKGLLRKRKRVSFLRAMDQVVAVRALLKVESGIHWIFKMLQSIIQKI